MKKLMMIALVIAFGCGVGFAQDKPDSETPKCQNCNVERGVPFLSNVPHAKKLFTNVGTICTCDKPAKQEDEPVNVAMSVLQLKHIDAADALATLNAVCEFEDHPETKVILDARTNSIVATGPKDDLEVIGTMLTRLDKPKIARTNFTTPVKTQDDLAETNVELRIKNAVLEAKLEAMEEKVKLLLENAELRAKLNEKESKQTSQPTSKPKSKPPTPPVFGSPGPNVDGPGPVTPGFQPSTFNPIRTNVPSKSISTSPPISGSFKSSSNGFSTLPTNHHPPTRGEAKPASSNPQLSVGQLREIATLETAIRKLQRENQKQRVLIQKLQKDKK